VLVSENVGDSSARPDLELEEEFGEDEGTINEQEMAEAEAGCGQAGIGIPLGEGRAHSPADTPAASPCPAGTQRASRWSVTASVTAVLAPWASAPEVALRRSTTRR
jgi:hypothetical protein